MQKLYLLTICVVFVLGALHGTGAAAVNKEDKQENLATHPSVSTPAADADGALITDDEGPMSPLTDSPIETIDQDQVGAGAPRDEHQRDLETILFHGNRKSQAG